MRKLYIILLALTLVMPLAARERSHMTFQQIPLTGTEKQMKDSLRAHGFHWGMNGLRMKGFIGNVAGKKMTVTINVTPETGTVYSVVAHGDKIRKWDFLKKEYLDIKAICKKKFGRPVSHSERFHKLVLGRASKRRAVVQGKCDYQCAFKDRNGMVIVYISPDRRVCIEWQDNENAALNEEEIMSEM